MWGEITVGELIETGDAEIVTGPFGTQLKAAEYVQAGWPVINVRNVGFGEVRKGDLEFVDDEKAESLARHRLQAGDIVFGRKGAVERHALISAAESGWVQGSDCIRLRIDPNRFRPMFASYALRTDWHQQWMKNLCSFAATMASLNQDIVRLIELPDVPLRVQDLVIEQLSCFDDLIENNRRRIEILEEMARLLYREWFVHFRFPGHEDVELVESELGLIPEGWRPGCFGDLVEEQKASVPEDAIPIGSPVVGLEHLPRRSTTLVQWDLAETVGSRRKVFERDDILFGKIRPYFHKVVDAPMDGFCSTDAIVFRPVGFPQRALCIASSDEFVAAAVATSNGTKMPRADTRLLLSYPVAHPGIKLSSDFDLLVQPMSALRRNLASQNRVLREARDLLLPRLVSGELDVSELDLDGVLG